MMHVSAAVSVMPWPPARVDSRKTKPSLPSAGGTTEQGRRVSMQPVSVSHAAAQPSASMPRGSMCVPGCAACRQASKGAAKAVGCRGGAAEAATPRTLGEAVDGGLAVARGGGAVNALGCVARHAQVILQHVQHDLELRQFSKQGRAGGARSAEPGAPRRGLPKPPAQASRPRAERGGSARALCAGPSSEAPFVCCHSTAASRATGLLPGAECREVGGLCNVAGAAGCAPLSQLKRAHLREDEHLAPLALQLGQQLVQQHHLACAERGGLVPGGRLHPREAGAGAAPRTQLAGACVQRAPLAATSWSTSLASTPASSLRRWMSSSSPLHKNCSAGHVCVCVCV